MFIDLPPLTPEKRRFTPSKRVIVLTLVSLVLTGVVVVAGALIWYRMALRPLNQDTQTQLFEVEFGQSTQSIARNLKNEGLIREDVAFRIYSRLNKDAGGLQVGAYELSPSQSIHEIHQMMVDGDTASRSVAIIPGFTINKIKQRLIDAGYAENDVEAALNGSYDNPVVGYIPDKQSLEGFLYPDTYIGGLLQHPSELIRLALEEMESNLTPALLGAFEQQELSVYQAVTLASIVQREIDDPDLQKQIAQVYLKRLREDIRLDADPTFRYASEQAGVPDQIDIDSPYNTRRVKGLPPGPIGAVTVSALEAVANPSTGDFLFFVTGDDGVTYFSRTLEEHENNVEQHCRENCQVNFD